MKSMFVDQFLTVAPIFMEVLPLESEYDLEFSPSPSILPKKSIFLRVRVFGYFTDYFLRNGGR